MAENGDRGEVRGKVAGQEFSIVTKDIVTVLLILCGVVGGFVAWLQLDKRVETTWKYVDSRLVAMEQQHGKFFDMLLANRTNTHQELQEAKEHLTKQLWIVNWNCVHDPAQQLPIGINGPPAKPNP